MRFADISLLEGEQLMSTPHELAYRQMTPHMLEDDGKVASTVFGPASSDAGKPSYSRGSQVSAQEARDWHTRNAKSPSTGVYAVSVGEVIAAGRYTVDDSQCVLPGGTVRAPGHCFVDFRGLDRTQKKELRARLYMYAMERKEIPTEATLEDGHLF